MVFHSIFPPFLIPKIPTASDADIIINDFQFHCLSREQVLWEIRDPVEPIREGMGDLGLSVSDFPWEYWVFP